MQALSPLSIGVGDPKRKGRRHVDDLETETIDLLRASGRVLAHTLRADAPQPRFDYSAMDGYAVDIADFDRALPIRLRVTGRITASRMTDEVALQPRSALRILNGAPIP